MDVGRTTTKKKRLLIVSLVIAAAVAITILLAPPGRGGQEAAAIQAKWIEPQVAGDTVSISVSEVESNRNVHFQVETESGNMHFMAYLLDAQIHVRANVCPPCRGIGYSLDGNVLVCDRCATMFRASTGEGIGGACVNYPKAAVAYSISNGSIVMRSADLVEAYQNTLQPGLP
jgi:nitrite reductase/ring-hydroxylating ferredoxin subunit